METVAESDIYIYIHVCVCQSTILTTIFSLNRLFWRQVTTLTTVVKVLAVYRILWLRRQTNSNGELTTFTTL